MYKRFLLFLAIFVLAAAAAAFADTLHGVNGDRLTGTLKGAESDALVFETYGGVLKVKRNEVAGLSCTAPVKISLMSGPTYEGALDYRDNIQYVLVNGAPTQIALADVASIALPVADTDLPALEPLSAPAKDGDLPALEPLSEPAEKPKDWTGSVEAGATWRSGQTDSLEGHTALNLTRKKEHDTLTLNANAGYGAVDSEVNTRRAKGEGKWQLYPREGMYYYVLGGLEHDAGRRLDLRANTAGGIGYDFIKKEKRSLSGDVGMEYAREYWNPYDLLGKEKAKAAAESAVLASAAAYLQGLRNDLNAPANAQSALQLARAIQSMKEEPEQTVNDDISLRLTGKYEQSIFAKSKVSNEVAVVPNVDNFEAYRLSNDLAFTTPLREGLSLRLNLKTELDSDIGSTGDTEADNSLFTTLRYEF